MRGLLGLRVRPAWPGEKALLDRRGAWGLVELLGLRDRLVRWELTELQVQLVLRDQLGRWGLAGTQARQVLRELDRRDPPARRAGPDPRRL